MHPIENIIESSIESIKRMVDVNTVIGDAITSADGTLLLPVFQLMMRPQFCKNMPAMMCHNLWLPGSRKPQAALEKSS